MANAVDRDVPVHRKYRDLRKDASLVVHSASCNLGRCFQCDFPELLSIDIETSESPKFDSKIQNKLTDEANFTSRTIVKQLSLFSLVQTEPTSDSNDTLNRTRLCATDVRVY